MEILKYIQKKHLDAFTSMKYAQVTVEDILENNVLVKISLPAENLPYLIGEIFYAGVNAGIKELSEERRKSQETP